MQCSVREEENVKKRGRKEEEQGEGESRSDYQPLYLSSSGDICLRASTSSDCNIIVCINGYNNDNRNKMTE